ncbi:hypothetical protein Patl1_33474 [Pistacia atlantica]|uniref:Uncharacterized protein n=1 Tax=Pistacia atlantica TaxID=434234 RepID=A0ACC0ZWG3_9ROSI|nr:hypothetical protein Patl1_33474 [Pistacia atlantica]
MMLSVAEAYSWCSDQKESCYFWEQELRISGTYSKGGNEDAAFSPALVDDGVMVTFKEHQDEKFTHNRNDLRITQIG